MDYIDGMTEASDLAFARLKAVKGELSALPIPIQTLIRVYSGQGVIDNGGFQYFFEADWPGTPSYTEFSAAYRLIGASAIAEAIDNAVACFPFNEPHLKLDERNAFLDSLPVDHALFRLGDFVCGNKSVWDQLSSYARANAEVFRGT